MVVSAKNANVRKPQPLKKTPKGIIPVRNPITVPEEKTTNGAVSSSKIHAQRKFAQGAAVRSTGCSPLKLSKTGLKKKKADKPISPVPCAPPPLKRPKTEDFLAFLCYRSTPVLPQELDFFNYPQTEGIVENITKNRPATQVEVCPKKEESTVKNDVTSSTSDAVIQPSAGPSTSSVVKTKEKTAPLKSNNNDKKNNKTLATLKKIPSVMAVVKQAEKAVAAINKVKKDVPPDLVKPTRINEQDARFAMTALTATTAMTALKLKYQEKRLAKPKPTISVVSKITKKVKGRNVILTRSKAHKQGDDDDDDDDDEDEKKSSPKPKAVSKSIVVKHRLQKDIRPRSRNAPSPDIIYGVIHSKNIAKKVPSQDSSGEESSKSSSSSSDSSKSSNSTSEDESEVEETPVVRSLRNGKQFVAQAKKPSVATKTATPHKKVSTVPARISTRSSHRKSTSPLRELPMYGVKKRKLKKSNKGSSSKKKKVEEKPKEKQKSKDEPNQPSHRPTRKTKETASIYLGLINTFSSDEEEDNNGKNKNEDESSGDSSSSETKHLEKQYNASIKRVEQSKQSATSKVSKKSSSSTTTTTGKGGIGKAGKGSLPPKSSSTKMIPVKRVLRSQSSRSKSLKAPIPRRIGTRRLTTPVASCDRRSEGAARKSAATVPKRRSSNDSSSQSSPSSESANESGHDDESEDGKSSIGGSSSKSVTRKAPSTTQGGGSKGTISLRSKSTKKFVNSAKTRASTQPKSSAMKNSSSKESNKSDKESSSEEEEEEEEEEDVDKSKTFTKENVAENTVEHITAVAAAETKTVNSNSNSRVVEIHHATPSTSPSTSSSDSSSGENSDEEVTSDDDEVKPIVEKTSIAIQVDMDIEENTFENTTNMNDVYQSSMAPPPLPSSSPPQQQHNLTHSNMVNNFMPSISLSHPPPPPPMPFSSLNSPGPSFYPTLNFTPPIQLLARGAQEFSFNHPGITMNIPVSVPMYNGPLLQPSAMCFSSTSISAATLQTHHIRSVAANLDIPLVRPMVHTNGAENPMNSPNNLMNNATNCSIAMTRPLNFWSNNYTSRTAHTSAFRVPIPGGNPLQSSSLMVNPNHSMLPLSIVHPQQLSAPSVTSCIGQVQLNQCSNAQQQQQHHHHQQQQRMGETVSQVTPQSSCGNTPGSTSGYSILQSLPNISIVPKFNRNSKPVVLPDDQEALERQIKQSNKESRKSSSSKSSKGYEERKDKESKRKRKSFVIPTPTSPLTVRKDSTNPVTYVGVNTKKGSKSSGTEKVKEPKADKDPFNKLLQMKKADSGKSSSSNSSSSSTLEFTADSPLSSSPLQQRPSSVKESNNKSELIDSRQVENGKGESPSDSPYPNAPTFYPDDEQFQDPLKYIEKIRAEAEPFGIARIVPPRSFRPDCNVDDDMRFTAYNHYIHKTFQRWGPNVHETVAMKQHLRKSDVVMTVPMIGGMEIDLCTLYHTVQSFGGLKETIEKQKWNKVSDAMHIPRSANDRASKLDSVYVKYVLPYEMLSDNERKRLLNKVERNWNVRQEKLRKKAMNSDDSESESDKDSLEEEDDCIIKGKSTPLSSYFRVARNTRSMLFQNKEPTCTEVEKEYWKIVSKRTRHLCVYSGSIDCAGVGWGFPTSNKHPWNLKVLANNSGSVLRSMGPVMGATVPTLHVGMVFTTYCWYRDPHGLPWIEYLHSGGNKIWYAIPASEQDKFRGVLKELMPLQCKNKKIWLASDSAMVPPEMLQEKGISLYRAVQSPGEFFVVFPKAFTSAICTSYVISESVCFAPPEWLSSAPQIFDDIKRSKEPPVFPLERLLLAIIQDNKSSTAVLRRAIDPMEKIVKEEFALRKKLIQMGIHTGSLVTNTDKATKKKERKEDDVQQCHICNYILYLSLVSNETHEFTYCLPHALEYFLKHKSHVKTSVLRYDHSEEKLEELVAEVANRFS